MRLLDLFHRLGLNAALLVGLCLMPVVVAAGYWADKLTARDDRSSPSLRGTIGGDASR